MCNAGYGANGRLGTNDTTDSAIPALVAAPGALSSGWFTISTGSDHTCALAAGSSNDIYCWGGSAAHVLEGLQPAARAWKEKGGGDFALSPRPAPHRAGDGADGKLGFTTSYATVPTLVAAPGAVTAGWAAVSAASQHTCALAAGTGDAYCFGG